MKIIAWVAVFAGVASWAWRLALNHANRRTVAPVPLPRVWYGWGQVGKCVKFAAPNDAWAALVLLAISRKELPSLYYKYPIEWTEPSTADR